MIKFANVIMHSENATIQDAFKEWVGAIIGELAGPEGQMPDDDEVESYVMGRFREMRRQILSDTDWIMLEDSPLNGSVKNLWKTWRQALRDLPQHYPDVRKAVFPEPPPELGNLCVDHIEITRNAGRA